MPSNGGKLWFVGYDRGSAEMGEILCGSQAEFRCGIVERLAVAQKSAPLN